MASGRAALQPAAELLEEVACNLCGSRDTLPLLRKDGFTIVRCRKCGLGYVNPRLKAAANAEQYDAEYYAGGSYRDYLAERAGYERTFARRLQRIETWLGKPGRILDVGCAYGFFLTVAARRGWDAHGIDISEDAVRYAAGTLGLQARAVTLDEAGFPPGYFDAVVMNDTFEHLADPLGELRRIHRVLRPGGSLVLVTQDSRGAAVRLLGRRWAQWKPREHLYYYTRKTLQALLERAGFTDVTIEDEGLYCTVDFLTGKLGKVAPALGRLASATTRALHLGQVLVPVWTGYEVIACATRRTSEHVE